MDGRGPQRAAPARRAAVRLDGDAAVVDGAVAFVPDAPGADLLVVGRDDGGGDPVAVALPAEAEGVTVEPVRAL